MFLRSLLSVGVIVAASTCSMDARADSHWQAVLEVGETVPLVLRGVQPQADGTVLVRADLPPNDFWTLLLDDELRVVDRSLDRAWTSLPLGAVAGDGALVLLPYFNDGISIQHPSRLCWLWRDALGGLDVRSTHDTVAPHADSAVLRRLDAGGVHYGILFYNGPSPLVGFQEDCNPFFIPAPRDWIEEVFGIPNVDGAYTIASDEAGGRSLKRVNETGDVWSQPLGSAHTTPALGLSVAGDGDALVIQSSLAGGSEIPRRIVSRFDLSGTLLWSKTFDAEPWPRALLADGDRTVIVLGSTLCGASSTSTAAAVDVAGNELWREPLASCGGHGLYDANPRRTPLLLDASGKLWTITASGLQTFAESQVGQTPLARTADGAVLIAKGDVNGAAARLAQHIPGLPTRDIGLEAPVPQAPRAVLHDSQGAFVVIEGRDGTVVLVHFSPTGTKRWQRELTDTPASGSRRIVARFDVAANGQRICLWKQLDAPGTSRLTCRRRSDGAELFPWFDMPFRYSGAPSALRIEDDGTVDALGTGCYFEPSDSTCVQRARRTRLNPQGHVERSDNYGGLSARSEFGVRAIAADRSGDIAVFYNTVDGMRLEVVDRLGAVRWGKLAGAQIDPLALGDDGSLLVRENDRFELYDPQGTPQWSYSLPDGAAPDSYAMDAAMLPSGDLVLLGNTWQGKRFRALLRASDGRPRWKIGDDAQSRYDTLASLRVSADGRHVFLLPNWEEDQRVIAFSTDDGAIVGAAARTGLPPMQTGATVASLGTDGSLLVAQGVPSAGRIEIEHRPSGMQNAADAVAIDNELWGTWQAQDASGQGFFLANEGDLVYGAWFTYTQEGGHAAAEQRWYTIVGDARAATRGTALKIYRSAPGVFAQGPAVAVAQVGEARLWPLECNRLLLVYGFTADEQNGRNGAIPLVRTTPPIAGCESVGDSSPYSGAWYDPSASGQGVVFDLQLPTDREAGLFAGGWLTFDAESQPGDESRLHWFTLAGPVPASSNGTIRVPIYRTVGGRLDAEPTNNSWQVGEAVFTFSACDRAMLAYSFTNERIAHGFRGKHGTLQLQRATPCGGG